MDQIDHVMNRVSLAACTGLLVGGSVATYRGAPLHKTSLSVALSFALTGTACFGAERLTYNAIHLLGPTEIDKQTKLYASHCFGGIVGGGICGGLYKGQPFAGALMFTPILLGVAYAELLREDYKKDRIRELQSKPSVRENG